ncbi:1230_t:CDS:2, partial [Funneliformis mosseae]
MMKARLTDLGIREIGMALPFGKSIIMKNEVNFLHDYGEL